MPKVNLSSTTRTKRQKFSVNQQKRGGGGEKKRKRELHPGRRGGSSGLEGPERKSFQGEREGGELSNLPVVVGGEKHVVEVKRGGGKQRGRVQSTISQTGFRAAVLVPKAMHRQSNTGLDGWVGGRRRKDLGKQSVVTSTDQTTPGGEEKGGGGKRVPWGGLLRGGRDGSSKINLKPAQGRGRRV